MEKLWYQAMAMMSTLYFSQRGMILVEKLSLGNPADPLLHAEYNVRRPSNSPPSPDIRLVAWTALFAVICLV